MKVYGWIQSNEGWSKIHIKNYEKKACLEIYDPFGRILIAKQGSKHKWHFALKSGQTQYLCDSQSYKKNKCEWHELWQSYSPNYQLESYRYKDNIFHIADLIDKFGLIVEFQHSNISAADVSSREELYSNEHNYFDSVSKEWKISTGGMYWVIDATNSEWIKLETKKILIREKYSWWNFLTQPVFFDIGAGIACLDRRYYKAY
jgi:hypothetical protein